MNRSIIKTFIVTFMILLFSFCLMLFPEQSLHASVSGLHIWLEVVFPSLFPFFICAELFTRYGIAHFLGHICEPIMRPLFNIPGIGSIALFIGMISGYPSGAKISTQLRTQNLISRVEAERLLAFTNNASPLFIFGVIAIGFYQNEKIGFFILFVHYISNLLVGICMRWYKYHAENTKETYHSSLLDGLRKMHHIRVKNHEPIGQQLSEIIIQSAQTLCIIGGYIILFSVLTMMINQLSLAMILIFVLQPVTQLMMIPSDIIAPMITGILEITLGTKQLANAHSLSIPLQVIGVCFLLGFNSISVHAQVASIISTSDIRYFPYLLGRIFHSCISVIIAICIMPFVQDIFLSTDPANRIISVSSMTKHVEYVHIWMSLLMIVSLLITCIYLRKNTD